jgi:2-aminoadipate transaminase
MSEERRREVLALAERHDCVVVEDDWAGDLRLDGRDLPTLHALDGGRRVIYVSTFSKKLMPGLRVGWVASPPAVQQRLTALKQIEDCGTSPLIQEALHRFLRKGGLERHLSTVRTVYRERRDRMLDAIERHFPEDVRVLRPRGGLFVWVTLPAGLDANELFLLARQRGVLISPGELFHVDGPGRDSLRLTFAAVGPEGISRGIETLGKLMKEVRTEGSPEISDDRSVEAMPIV